jgi:hypothetical protein
VALTVAIVGLAGACSSNDTTETGGDAESSSSTTSSAGGGSTASHVPSEIDGEQVSSCEFDLTNVDFDAADEALVEEIGKQQGCVEWATQHPEITNVALFVAGAAADTIRGSSDPTRQAANYREQYADVARTVSLSAGDCANASSAASPEDMGSCKTGMVVVYRDEIPADVEARIEGMASGADVEESEQDGFRVISGQGIAVALGDDTMLVASASDPEPVLRAMIDA